eukprot:6191165-Pleurochrysis_carterae.AAC.3
MPAGAGCRATAAALKISSAYQQMSENTNCNNTHDTTRTPQRVSSNQSIVRLAYHVCRLSESALKTYMMIREQHCRYSETDFQMNVVTRISTTFLSLRMRGMDYGKQLSFDWEILLLCTFISSSYDDSLIVCRSWPDHQARGCASSNRLRLEYNLSYIALC